MNDNLKNSITTILDTKNFTEFITTLLGADSFEQIIDFYNFYNKFKSISGIYNLLTLIEETKLMHEELSISNYYIAFVRSIYRNLKLPRDYIDLLYDDYFRRFNT